MKLKEILLVDDSRADNYLHQMVIDQAEVAELVSICANGREALEYLTREVEGESLRPDLIFLDINMPVMNGWQFLEEYRQLPTTQRSGVVVVMLTTSDNPDDIEAARGFQVAQYISKPLSQDTLQEILGMHFPNRFAAGGAS